MSEDDASIDRLFDACDLDGSGYIDEEELSRICSDLSVAEVKQVFEELDRDGNGRITKTEFREGFRGIQQNILGNSQQFREKRRLSCLDIPRIEPDEHKSKPTTPTAEVRKLSRLSKTDSESSQDGGLKIRDVDGLLDEAFRQLSCQEQVCELYQSLHGSHMPEVLSQFEDIVLGVIKDIRQQQFENERLEKSLQQEKERHMAHLKQLEEETETQVMKVGEQVRQEEAEKSDQEKAEIRAKLEAEVIQLQNNLTKLQKVEQELSGQDKPDGEIKYRLDETIHENRCLRSNLTDAETNLALLRSEIAAMRQVFEEKCYELDVEKSTLVDYTREQDNLSKQVAMLHGANQKLHDTNDDLRSALENARVNHRRRQASPLSPGFVGRSQRSMHRAATSGGRSSRGSMTSMQSVREGYVHEYLRSSVQSLVNAAPLADEFKSADRPVRRMVSNETFESESLPDDLDSGHSTMRDHHDGESEYGPNSVEDEVIYAARPRRRNHVIRVTDDYPTTESDMPESDHDFDDSFQGHSHETEIDMLDCDLDAPRRIHLSRSSSHACSVCSHESGSSLRGGCILQRQISPIPPPPPVVTKEPERMYKVVLAGDAAVGKSSFIMRLCKDKFIPNLNSTLGVDFQTKVLDVDGRVVALQLWDTAGQERFRSIAKSYFRRADGVLLVYDCTYERSFMSVRDWVDAVEEGAQHKLPIMIVANKIDMRSSAEAEGKRCVRYDEGKRLAREYDALFIETSAKNGRHIYESVTELARLLRTTEDLEVQHVGMKIHAMGTEKDKLPCCNS